MSLVVKKTRAYDQSKIDLDKCVDNIGNRFDLVLVASQRVRELSRGNMKQVNTHNGVSVTALQEIEQGFVTRDYLKRIRFKK
jgi:DNA-directed RNA polymerase subunit omega